MGKSSIVENYKYVAKTFAGLEGVLAKELIDLGASNVEEQRRAVSFEGDKEMLYRANYCCRTALRILKPIYEFDVVNRDTLYEEASKVDWTKYLTLGKTFALDSVVTSDLFANSMYVSLRVKDAIVDQFRKKYKKRPSVDPENADIKVHVHLMGNKCSLSLDSSGEALYRRGYRVGQNDAPLSEVLAAGMILLSGWDQKSAFVDPMCGSGTLLIEAAMIAYGIPPGVYRQSFGFENWPDFDPEAFEKVYDDDYDKEFDYPILGSDVHQGTLKIAEKNIRNANLFKYIHLKHKDIRELKCLVDGGIIITNPPYGERMKPNSIENLYRSIGDTLKTEFAGYDAWILSSSKEGFKSVGLRTSQKIKLFNGPLECNFNHYELYEGSKKNAVQSEEEEED